MYSALVGSLVLLSIGILMAHAMEGLWQNGRRAPVFARTPFARDPRRDAAGS
jgi:hypothetical protein